MHELNLKGLTKRFGETEVLKGIDLSIRPGEFLTLVGPSGCGKSTLLRIIAGLETPDTGRIQLDGRDVTDLRAAERDLAMVFQSYALYPHLTVAENMLTPLKLRNLGWTGRLPVVGPILSRGERAALMARVRDVAEVLKITPLLGRKPGQLSGGQRQRVALGRAMVREPAAFLMDEPLSNLDAALRVHMRAELSGLHRQLGRTFIYVTHDQAEALTMSDRMAVMMGGEILQLDTPANIYDDPNDLRVAQFVGSPAINLLPGEVDDQGRVSYCGVPLERRLSGAAQGPVSIGLRPEHLHLATPEQADALNGRVTFAENLGADTYLHVALGDGAHPVQLRIDSHIAAGLAPGAEVHVRHGRGAALIFDGAGKRLRFAETTAPAAQRPEMV